MRKFLFLLLSVCCLLASCTKTETKTPTESEPTVGNRPIVDPKPYVPTDTTISFKDDNADKVNYKNPTFNVDKYTESGKGNIKLYQLFGDGMCLQRDAINRIWGKVSGSKNIAIEFDGVVYYGTVGEGRAFEVYLPKMNAGGPYEMTIIAESGRMTIKDVYVGEVYLCSGQSNMEWQIGHSGDVLKEYYSSSDAENDNIRMYNLGFYPQNEPTTEVVNNCKWEGANQSTVKAFSAVGYIFGKQLQEELDCPVGLIWAAIGGSSIEFWLSEENYDKVKNIYKPYTTSEIYMTPCQGYNGMLYPLTGINTRGVLWYQGCSNAFGTQKYYDQALEIFIDQCRDLFDNDQLSFTICQLARYEGNPYAYSIVNEKINLVAAKDPYVVVSRNLDQGDWKDIHPKDKVAVAERAAYETLRVFFKYDKPEPIKVTDYTFNEDGTVTITLSDNAILKNGNNGFEVCINGKFTYNCKVSIDGNKLTIIADGDITQVRYGYTCNMTEEIMSDVSKMVTVYDSNGFPLDLFLISKTE